MPDLAIVIPVYNEEGSIAVVVQKWMDALGQIGIDYRMSIYNDGSSDATGRILSRLSESNPRLAVHDKKNSGHGPTILRGYRENLDCPWIFQIDSDDEMGPDSFGQLWDSRNQYDILIGRRSTRANQLSRRVISLMSRAVVRVFYGPGFWDVNSPYRLMRSSVFRDLFLRIPDDTFAPNVIISGFAHRHNVRAYETQVSYTERRTGTVSLRKLKMFKAAMRSFRQTIAFALKNQ
jgi:glycosyltransferase involved in cell wall biosynthesis